MLIPVSLADVEEVVETVEGRLACPLTTSPPPCPFEFCGGLLAGTCDKDAAAELLEALEEQVEVIMEAAEEEAVHVLITEAAEDEADSPPFIVIVMVMGAIKGMVAEEGDCEDFRPHIRSFFMLFSVE